jgi:membrane-bound lytic murein transglycosylase MltF
MELTTKQLEIKNKIVKIAEVIGLDPAWAVAIAMTESSLGLKQKSPTGCKGVFQMSSIAMKDLLKEMEKSDDDIIDITCGLAFLHLLLKRHKTIEEATKHFCDPADREFYVDRVMSYIYSFKAYQEAFR